MKKTKPKNLKAALKYRKLGLNTIPTTAGNKKTPVKWSEVRDNLQSSKELRELFRNHPKCTKIAVIAGSVSGVTILDVDNRKKWISELTKRGFKADWKKLIKLCPTVWRGHKNKYHLYFKYTEYPINGSPIPSVIEVKNNNRGLCTAPPSKHPSGEFYRWKRKNPLKGYEFPTMPYWLKDLLVEISGKAHKNLSAKILQAETTIDGDEDVIIEKGNRQIYFFHEACSQFRRGLTEYEILSSAYQRHEQRTEKDGFDLNEVKQCVESAKRYFETSPFRVLDELNRSHCVVNLSGRTRIATEVNETGYIEYSQKEDFLHKYVNQRIPNPRANEKGQLSYTTKGKFWWEHPDRPFYSKVILDPTTDERFPREGIYNIYRGFRCHPKKGNVKKYLKLIYYMTEENEDLAKWVLTRLAVTIQDPGQEKYGKIVTSINLMGKQGTGKSSLFNYYGNLWNDAHYVCLKDKTQITGRFNSILEGKIVIFADEVFWGGDKPDLGRLKGYASDQYMNIERKGIEPYTVRNYGNLFTATNNLSAVPVEEKERRFLPLTASDKLINKKKWWKKFHEYMNNRGSEALLYHLLYEVDIDKNIEDGYDPRSLPQTATLWDQKLRGLSTTGRWIFNLLLEKEYFKKYSNAKIDPDKLWRDYLKFGKELRENNIKFRPVPSLNVLTREIRERFLPSLPQSKPTYVKGEEGRPYRIHLPNLEQARREFEKSCNAEGIIKWEDVSENYNFLKYTNYQTY